MRDGFAVFPEPLQRPWHCTGRFQSDSGQRPVVKNDPSWHSYQELLVPLTNGCSERISQFDSLSLTPRGAPLRGLYVRCAPIPIPIAFLHAVGRPSTLGL